MKCLIGFCAVMICDVTLAQDPTVPSSKILERLQHEQRIPLVAMPATGPLNEVRAAAPELKLKAMVLTDSDHGTALIEVDGRRVRLQLSRPTHEQMNAPESSSQIGINGVVIQGSTYHVQSFSARSILLTNGTQTLLVQ